MWNGKGEGGEKARCEWGSTPSVRKMEKYGKNGNYPPCPILTKDGKINSTLSILLKFTKVNIL